MALKEYIGLQRITEIFRLLKSKIDTKAELAESMTTEEFEDAENLPDGIYPIEEEDLVPITADMVKYDSENTVEDKIDEIVSSGGATITSYTLTLDSSISGVTATAIKFGKLVILNVQGSVTSVIANSATICSGANFPAALAPKNNLGWTFCGTMCTAAPSSTNMTYVPCAISLTSTGFAMANDYGGSMYAPRATLIYEAAN